ncbi:MAG: 2-dehydropantoate 2-reductase [Pseudomonadales bacterium]
MKIAVFGAGGVGAYYGGRLAQAGHDVAFIARGTHLAAMRTGGLRVDSIAGDFVIEPVNATDAPAEVGAVDAVLVAVKAWQVEECAQAMKPMLGSHTLVVPLQNGIDAPEVLAAALGDTCVLGGACGISAFIVGPGHVSHVAVDPYIQFGARDDAANPMIEKLHAAFAQAKGVSAEISDDIQATMWQKFLGVAPIGAVGAITRAPIGVMVADPQINAMLESAKHEIWAVGKVLGVNWAAAAIERVTAVHGSVPFGTTASMARDILEGRPSELDGQVGAIVRLGAELGVPTPVNRFVLDCLLPQERRARGELEF